VGFMALLIAGLALNGVLLKHAKIGVMVGSLLSAIAGLAILFWLGRHSPSGETTSERS
jgi:Na+/H+ antiporter NhaA